MQPAHPLPAQTAPAAAAGPRWQLRLLGDVLLRRPHGAPQHLPGRAATALLARLALAPDQAQPREVLIELLWPGVALDVGRNRLWQVLSTLKSLLDASAEGGTAPVEVVIADRLAVRLTSRLLHCDAAAFEAATRAGHGAEALPRLPRATAAATPQAGPAGLNLPRAWVHACLPEAAARLMGFAEQHAAAICTLTAADRHDLRRMRRLCQRLAPAADVARWWADGAQQPPAQAVRLALQRSTP
jgi:hypothetical protein